ncbi:hypothetical protein Ciccas_003712 [Cichlidogyrus casuarinus]|uniref:Uncharacterized protein n=1 Tax=Cichlidogyrus casuarinus TaxID=1844966 RepID=A0ABD2QDK7_9PLAT
MRSTVAFLCCMVLIGSICVPESEGFVELAGCLKTLVTRMYQCVKKCHTVHRCPLPEIKKVESDQKDNAAKRLLKSIARKFKECACGKCALCAGKCLVTVGLGDESCGLVSVINDIAQLFGAAPPISGDKKGMAKTIIDVIMNSLKVLEA